MTESAPQASRPRKAPSQQRSRERVAAILAATRRLLETQGVAAVTTPRIAAEAAIPVGSIYQFFPNKQAIFVALYSEYLASICHLIETFTPARAGTGWQAFFLELNQAILRQEQQYGGAHELYKAMSLYPELDQLDDEHGVRVEALMVGHMERLGARAPRDKLARLSRFIYSLNAGVWLYQSDQASLGHQAETMAWEIAAFMAVLATVFEPAD